MDRGRVEKAYALAKEQYAEFGVDTDAALEAARHRAHLAALLAGRRRRRVRTRDGALAAGSWPRATIPARPATPTSFAPTSKRS